MSRSLGLTETLCVYNFIYFVLYSGNHEQTVYRVVSYVVKSFCKYKMPECIFQMFLLLSVAKSVLKSKHIQVPVL